MKIRNLIVRDGGDRDAEIRCRPFTGQAIEWHRVRVLDNREVLVWDEIAGHYTRCHDISDRAVRHIASIVRGM